MRNKKALILLIALIVTAIVAISTYAIYKSTATGVSGFKTAAWNIKLNNQNITTSNTFTFDLKDAEWTHSTVIDSDETEVVVIAPGSYGTYGITIDASDTEVDVLYSVTAVVKQGNNTIDLSTINPNLSLGFYKDDELQGNPINGSIVAHGTYTGDIRIVWNEVDSIEANSQDININDQNFVVEVTVVTQQKPLPGPKCVRATELHTDGSYTYGNDVATRVDNVLEVGDAFDCDVNGDGNYTERFYYLSDYFDQETKSYNESYAVLLYYNFVTGGVAENVTPHAYYATKYSNYEGPITAALELPTTSQWSNVSLYKTSRQLLTEDNLTSYEYSGTNYLVAFDYSSYAARLPIYQEIIPNCGIENYDLGACSFLIESYSNTLSGYWLDTPRKNPNYDVYLVNYHSLNQIYSKKDYHYGVKPAIEVLKTDIDY